MKHKSNLQRALMLATVLAIAGCGGGGGGGGFPVVGANGAAGNGASTSTVPASAMQSVGAFMAFMKGLVASSSETDSPMQLGDAVVPISETDPPSGP
ncbi:hypothetical protein QTI33_07960 [Variovorax sp. J22P271]|uniref:hypothetical protein n=1 Tax=Variovorax davisae TaxID=3053515 RepID=UPI002576B339|nr:hypothetical protein [Variovorax sp. J22P271]MDM0032076.1 hypothetical protein [Variovorax sp. J22P271]